MANLCQKISCIKQEQLLYNVLPGYEVVDVDVMSLSLSAVSSVNCQG